MVDSSMYNEFKDYAGKHMGISSMQLYYWERLQDSLYSHTTVSNSLTPMILEERQLNVTQIDVFSRMMMDRILWLCGPVNDRMSTVVQAQLMYLDTIDQTDITLHIDSPGGSVKSGLAIVDVMDYVSSDVMTINTGMAASMGAILLGAGTKGKRLMLPNSRVMIHQVSAGAQGTMADIDISIAEGRKYNTKLFNMLSDYTGKTAKQIMKDADRDMWLDAEQAKTYGVIDSIITKKIKK